MHPKDIEKWEGVREKGMTTYIVKRAPIWGILLGVMSNTLSTVIDSIGKPALQGASFNDLLIYWAISLPFDVLRMCVLLSILFFARWQIMENKVLKAKQADLNLPDVKS